MAATDSAGGGLGQAAKDLLKEMQRAQTEMQQQVEQKSQTQGSDGAFQQAMQNQVQQNPAGGMPGDKGVRGVGGVQGGQAGGMHGQEPGVSDILRQAQAGQAPQITRVGFTERTAESKLQKMLDGLVGGQDKMTQIMKLAMSGRQFAPNELLAMQAGVYRFSQELDLTSKVVQQATSGIKQTLNTQV